MPVEIVDYDPEWPRAFDRIRMAVGPALGDLAVAIEHVGSTSIPGCAAKPIIDLDVVVASAEDVPCAIAVLESLGYTHKGDQGIPGREAFAPPRGEPNHHLYVCTGGADELARHIAFRDYLRRHPEAVDEYRELKRDLARRHRDDRVAYTEAKTAFIARILDRMRAEAGGAR